MHAIAIDAYGETPRLRELPAPVPAHDDDVLVRVEAAGVHPIDAMIVAGAWRAMPVRFPLTPGLDFAGVIEATGERVCGRVSTAPVMQHGSFAELVVLPHDGAFVRIPDSLDFVQAAALPSAGMTALTAVEALAIAPGARVLVAGAHGGVGSYAVQLLRKRGAEVIAITRDDSIEALIDRLPDGADALLDLANDAPRLAALSAFVLDGGSVVSTRYCADVAALAVRNIRAVNVANKPSQARLQQLLDEALAPVAVQRFALADAAEALARFARAGVRGKMVLVPAR